MDLVFAEKKKKKKKGWSKKKTKNRGIRMGARGKIERGVKVWGGWFDEVVPPAVCKCENVVFHERNF